MTVLLALSGIVLGWLLLYVFCLILSGVGHVIEFIIPEPLLHLIFGSLDHWAEHHQGAARVAAAVPVLVSWIVVLGVVLTPAYLFIHYFS